MCVVHWVRIGKILYPGQNLVILVVDSGLDEGLPSTVKYKVNQGYDEQDEGDQHEKPHYWL
jgi:hypothetical protein